MTAIEFRDVYDGVSAYICEVCGDWRHRWPDGHPRRDRTETHMRNFVGGFRLAKAEGK
jgi:hypothetical protein